jgi:hypothetical protein
MGGAINMLMITLVISSSNKTCRLLFKENAIISLVTRAMKKRLLTD